MATMPNPMESAMSKSRWFVLSALALPSTFSAGAAQGGHGHAGRLGRR